MAKTCIYLFSSLFLLHAIYSEDIFFSYNNNNNNINNNNNNLLQLGCHPVAVVILHVNKNEIVYY